MSLPEPLINDIRGPSGPDLAASFGEHITLTYWDLWTLLAAQQRFAGNIPKLRDALVVRRQTGHFWSFRTKELVEDLIALSHDLERRITGALSGSNSLTEIISLLPERLVKKESAKAIRNILEQDCSYPPSEPMLRSPRRLLEKEAYRGMWEQLPINPTIFADKFHSLFIPKGKLGYFNKGSTFALRCRIEKRVDREILMGGSFVNLAAHQYAVYRSLVTLFQEEHSWDDSYGTMGELAQDWIKGIFEATPLSVGVAPQVFLKDLLMIMCWENYGLTKDIELSNYLNEKLTERERMLCAEILRDISTRAEIGYQNYQSEQAHRILKMLAAPMPKVAKEDRPRPSHLRLIASTT